MTSNLINSTYSVRRSKNATIPLSDGVELSADLFLPEESGPVPAILEYLPYRKDDVSAGGSNTHHYFAQRGFAGVRVDIRGTGGSGGVILDEYTPQEQHDACEVIAWLAQQPWCNGNVGMWGTSYGGFNTIQTAMQNPTALKAIAPHAATDDRYNEDVHYCGGCMMGLDLLIYPQWMISMNALPPHPQDAGQDWAKLWQQRLEGNPPWILKWLGHQREDSYWHQGSLKTDYGAIGCPTYHIGGWADGYTNSTLRMLEKMPTVTKGLIGPWNHGRPSVGYPGPNINYLHELARWWAHWLRGEETGIMDEPRIALYIQEGVEAHPFLTQMPGRWHFMDEWPPEDMRERILYLTSQGGLRDEPEQGIENDLYRYQATVGLAGGFWCPISPPYGMARDQAVDEARSLVYTTPPQERPLAILGTPRAVLHVSSTAEIAFFVVKISDVAPDGSSTLVSRGVLNATHRWSHSDPEPLTPGEIYELDIPLNVVSWTFQPGHRIRIAISSSDWPTIWPSPLPAMNRVYRGTIRPSHVVLPVVELSPSKAPEPKFLPPPELQTPVQGQGEDATWCINQDVVGGFTTVVLQSQGQLQPADESYALGMDTRTEIAASDERPDLAHIKGFGKFSILQRQGRTDVVGRAVVAGTATHLNVDIELRVSIDDEPFFTRHWLETFARDLL